MSSSVMNRPSTSPERMLDESAQNALITDGPQLPVAREDHTIFVDGEPLDLTIHHPMGSRIGDIASRVITGGFYGCKQLYDPMADLLASRGETVATFGQRRHPGLKGLRPRFILHPQRSLIEDTVAVATFMHNEYRIEEYHASGHSMGGQAVEGAAEYYLENGGPVRPASVTIFQGAGHTSHNTASLTIATKKLIPEIEDVREKSKELGDHLAEEAILYGLRNIFFTVAGGLQVSNCRGDRRLANLRRNKIPVIAKYNPHDPYFPAAAAYRQIGRLVSTFIYGSEDEGGHLDNYLHPEITARDLSYSLQELGFYSTPQPLLTSATS